jgi:steroid delta-isomerase-like uncharacterized protein
MTDQEKVAQAWASNEAFNAGDWDAFAAALTENVVYDEVSTGRRMEGREDFIALAQGWKAVFPDARGELQEAYVSGETVTMEIRWFGTHQGELPLPTGGLAPTGKAIDVPAVMIAKLEHGKSAHQRHYLDMLAMLTQLGAIPGGN